MTWLETLLWPFSVPYGAGAYLRARAYRTGLLKPKRLDGFVISVGNLTVGGTGKTPMTLWIAERLASEGKRAGILTRGYQGHSPESGDEVKLLRGRLADRVAIGAGSDRFGSGLELQQQGVEWFVLDDGFQHVQLERDVNIVLVDATRPFGGGHVLPAGRLREPRSALGRANIVIITRSSHAPAVEATVRRFTAAPIFYAQTHLDAIRRFHPGQGGEEVSPQAAGPVFAFCAIGNPPAFLEDLRGWGIHVAGHRFFRDHHRFTKRDLARIQQEAEATGAQALICTEKDLYNLDTAADIEWPVYSCAISMTVERAGEFWGLVQEIARSRHNSKARRASAGAVANR